MLFVHSGHGSTAFPIAHPIATVSLNRLAPASVRLRGWLSDRYFVSKELGRNEEFCNPRVVPAKLVYVTEVLVIRIVVRTATYYRPETSVTACCFIP